MSFCINCGNGLNADDMFCQSCGSPVKKDETSQDVFQTPPVQQPPVQPPPVQQQYQATPPIQQYQKQYQAPQQTQQYQQQYQAPQQTQYYQQQPAKKKSILPVILIIIFVIFILGGVGSYLTYRYFMKKATDTVEMINNKVEKEITKEIPKEIPKENEQIKKDQNNTESDNLNDTKDKKEVKTNKFDPNDVSEVTGDSGNNSGKYPGKYPEGSNMYLNAGDLSGYSKQELKIMRNEIFARHGYIFTTDDMKSYFGRQKWYTPERSNVDNLLSDIEKKNIATIKSAEKTK